MSIYMKFLKTSSIGFVQKLGISTKGFELFDYLILGLAHGR